MIKKCRRCAKWCHVVRTIDHNWICEKCKSHDREIALKVSKSV